MEKACAACGLEWNKELERGLRSKNLGQQLSSIQLMGGRLEKWSNEPNLKLATCNLFELVPGEDKLFADSILLRLADAFVQGNVNIRTHVAKVLLSDRQCSGRKKRQGRAILSIMTAENRLELIRRVRVTLDNGDFESKALILALFGCWAEFTSDIPEIRHAVLSSLVSSSILEVKASLFAAGCFCEYSDDFSSIFLVMIVNMISSAETLPMAKVAALRALVKVGNSPLLADKAYKAGSTILPNLSEDDGLFPILLISLSKLASRSILLSSKQVCLLCELLPQNITTYTQTIVLKCILYVVDQMPHGCFGVSSFVNICRIMNEHTPSSLRCQGLRIFVQVLSNALLSTDLLNTLDFKKLLRIIIDATSSEHIDERVLAFQALVDTSIRVKGWSKPAQDATSYLPLLPDIIISIGKEITIIMMSLPEKSKHPQVEQHLESFLAFHSMIVERCPDLFLLVLDNLSSILSEFMDVHENNNRTTETSSNIHQIPEVEETTGIFLFSKLLLHLRKFVAACLERLDVSNNITAEVVSKVRHLVCIVCQSSVLSYRVHLSFYKLLLSCSCLGSGALCKSNSNGEGSMMDINEIIVGKCLQNMLESRSSYWFAYLAGISAACEGVWSVAHLIFQQLSTAVNADIFCVWLTSLSQFAHSEKSIQVIFLQDYCSPLLNEGIVQSVHGDNNDILSMGSIQVLVDACAGLRSSERMLGTDIMPKDIFYFKKWFMALRLEVLEAVGNVAQLISKTPDDKSSMTVVDESSKLKRIADEYDLMLTAFINMENKSQRVISSLALGCSLLALCTRFYSLGEGSGDCFHHYMTLIHDLVSRVQDTDPATCTSLLSLLQKDGTCRVPSPSYSQFNAVPAVGHMFRFCREVVEGIVSLQNESDGMDDENTFLMAANKRKQFLLNVIREWFHVPFQIPKFFFQQRPCVGSALFCCNVNREERGELSVIQGSHLSLNLCLQLKNMPSDVPFRVTKIFCILRCKKSFLSSSTCIENSQATDTMMLLHKKLQWYVGKSYCESTSSVDFLNGDDNDGNNVVESCVSFEKTGSAQLYSSCLLDVSSFPVGSYKVQWFSCCVDRDGSLWTLLPLNSGPMFTVT